MRFAVLSKAEPKQNHTKTPKQQTPTFVEVRYVP